MTQKPTNAMIVNHYDCDVPGCSGPVNKRKLDAFDELLELLKRAAPYMKTVSRSGSSYDENDPNLYEEMVAAIAKVDQKGGNGEQFHTAPRSPRTD